MNDMVLPEFVVEGLGHNYSQRDYAPTIGAASQNYAPATKLVQDERLY